MSTPQKHIDLRKPISTDGAAVHRLISQCPPLDTNSMYCNLLQCTHFADTSVAAVQDNELVGFVSGYIIPQRADTLFVWQVAVSDKARGQGLAGRMLQHLLERPFCKTVHNLETTITETNQASWALFERLADNLGGELNKSIMFDREQHFAGEHDSELLARIGPFKNT